MKAPMTTAAPTEPRSRLRLAEKSNVYDLAGVRKKKVRDEIASLLTEAVPLKSAYDECEDRLRAIRARLFELAAELDTNGFKDDQIAFQYNGLRTRKTLSQIKLLENGVPIETIEASYTESDEYPDTKFVVFDQVSK